MTLYTVQFAIEDEFTETDATAGYKHTVIARDASDAFNQVFQRVADAAEVDYPDPATRPIMTLKITNHATGGEELPDPMRIKAYKASPEQPIE